MRQYDEELGDIPSQASRARFRHMIPNRSARPQPKGSALCHLLFIARPPARQQHHDRVKEILRYVEDWVVSQEFELNQTSMAIAEVDAIISLARTAADFDFCRPEMVEHPVLLIKQGVQASPPAHTLSSVTWRGVSPCTGC